MQEVINYRPETLVESVRQARINKKFVVEQPLTPQKLIGEITEPLNIDKSERIVVFYTVEWALYLRLNGYEDVTVVTEKPDPLVQRMSDIGWFKYTTLEKALSMHFDRLVGNPPFSFRTDSTNKSKDLDSLFLGRALTLADNVHLIVRSKHLTNPKSKFRKQLFDSRRVSEIKHVDKNHFPQILNTETCVISCQKNPVNATTITYSTGETKIKSLTSDDIIILSDSDYSGPVKNNMAHRWIRGKLNRNKIVDKKSGIKLIEVMGDDNNPVTRIIDQNSESTGYCQHGVIMNVCTPWGDLGKLAIKPYRAAISSSIVCLVTDSLEESQRLLEYLQTPEIREIVKRNMASFHPTKTLFTNIPDLI